MRFGPASSAAVLLTLVVPSALVASSALKQPRTSIDERALKPGTAVPGGTVLGATVYSGTLVGAPSWARPFADCTGLSGLGPVGFHSQPFFVSAAGGYDVASIQTGWDGFVFIYESNFDPNAPNTNCIAGNDDGIGGIGTSNIDDAPLTVGTQYFLITTAFENGEEGPFDNSIDGPGTVTLGGLGGTADLSITKTTAGVPEMGSFDYQLSVTNAGPDTADDTTVTDTLPAGLTFVSSTCGATVVGQVVSWDLGSFAVGAASCTLTVSIDTPGCAATTNTASVAAMVIDPNPANNTSTTTNANEEVADGSFEDGTPNGFWTEASTNFGTPLCDLGGCGNGTGTGPHTGDFWAWFGGIAAPETGSVSQSVTLPVGSVLTFFFEAPVCSNATDFVRAQIDGNTVWEATGAHPACNSVGYQLQTVDITAFADGGSHTLAFVSTISGVPGGSNFFIDTVSIAAATCVVGGGDADLVMQKTGVVQGDQIVYTLSVTNNGPDNATGVVVTDLLPAEVAYVSDDCGGADVPPWTWNVGALANGATATCNITVDVLVETAIVNTATASGNEDDPTPANNTGTSSLVFGSVLEIPTVGSIGLFALLALLALAGVVALRRGA